MTSTSRKRTWIAASSLFGLVLWGVAAALVDREIILPAPWAVLRYVGGLLAAAMTWRAVGATLLRVLLSFLMNIAASLILGTAAGFSDRFRFTLDPLITVMKAVPTMGVILLSLIWFDSETAVLFVCTLIVFPVLYSAVLEGIRGLDDGLREMHRVFRIPLGKTLRRFVLPSLRPFLVAGVTAGLGLSMKVIVAAEVLSQPGTGIGTMFQVERARLNTVGVFAWSVIVILLTAGLDAAFAALRRRFGERR